MSKRNNHYKVIMTGVDQFKILRPQKEEFVSIEAYDMLSNAFDAAMDEITMLRAKLARIQEVIKDE